MSKKILITGAAGFIGRLVTHALSTRKYDLFLLVRPGTNPKKLGAVSEKIVILEVDLRDIKKLRETINLYRFDTIIHIGAIRNRGRTSADDYFKANVQSTEQLAIRALETQAKFIYFSSVGVFGNIPENTPADNQSRKIGDNLYHESKIQSEKLINKYVLYGLNAVIIRPTITYGTGDYGFPYGLINLINKGLLILPRPMPDIHLCNVEQLVQATQRLVELDYKPGVTYNIGDRHPVNLLDLVDFISNELHEKSFSIQKTIPVSWFRFAERFFALIKCKTWQQRFQLFSHNWYYNVENAYEDLNLRDTETIPAIRSTIEWYQKTRKRKKT
ncbi:MAG: NAD(P)-dependent oxidoreductase [Candidatus Cloacimonetes bacterium]|nr:NAD(P)-dependent oxidoreductase [Candidatus Cloacimonadota bacterium]